jgi:hypothetical protein
MLLFILKNPIPIGDIIVVTVCIEFKKIFSTLCDCLLVDPY